MRTVKKIVASQKVDMGGIILDQPLPQRGMDQIDPFLLVHHWDDQLKGGELQQNVGVGPHPHRGFSPVTLIFNGELQHRDSEGNNSIVGQGGTQWMNSGKGIIHSERPTKKLAEQGGHFEIIQFWVNAPAKNKMDTPQYQPLSSNDTPKLTTEDQLAEIGVVAGEFKGINAVIDTYSPLLILRLNLKKGAKMDIPIPEEYNAFLYILDGELTINNKSKAKTKDLVWFENDGTEFSVDTKEDTRAILLSGSPLNENLVTYGPFVMNTEREIMDAIKDYQNGKMGILVENFEE